MEMEKRLPVRQATKNLQTLGTKDVWWSRVIDLIGGIFKVVSIVKICLDIINQYLP
jgi:hypothetical protein